MKNLRRHACVVFAGLFVLHVLFSSVVLAQEAVPVMTLADGTKVNMTEAQFDALVKQPGILYHPAGPAPKLTATQMAIPVPYELGGRLVGGGFIVGEPAAIAAGMNAVGITSSATAAGLAGGTAAAGKIISGAAAAVGGRGTKTAHHH
jgi:hypothetical protein